MCHLRAAGEGESLWEGNVEQVCRGARHAVIGSPASLRDLQKVVFRAANTADGNVEAADEL
jgi:hypothetical protein